MVKYRNPREMAELEADKQEEEHEKIMAEPATTVEEETWKKRYGDQRRYLDQIRNEGQTKIAELEAKLDQALRGQIKAPKSKDEVEAWSKEYPEFASILETILQDRIEKATKSTKEELNRIQDRQKELEVEEAKLALKKIHPDFEQLVNDENFHKWLQEQDDEMQRAIYSDLNVKRAAFVINMYKSEKGISKSKVDDERNPKEVAKVVKTPSPTNPIDDHGDYDFSESQIDRESRKDRRWFERNEEAIMTALRKGRVLMDVSGGAR